MDNNSSILGNLGNVEVKLNITGQSAVYLSLAIIVPIIIFFISKKIFE